MADQAPKHMYRAGPNVIHAHAVVVCADGGMLTYELPVCPGDKAEVEFTTEQIMDAPPARLQADPDPITTRTRDFGVAKDVELRFKVRYRGDLVRDETGGLYRTTAFGGAAQPTTTAAGREIPEHLVAMLANNMAWQPAGEMVPGTAPWAQAVRGLAQMLGQRLWDEAFLAGITYAQHLGLYPQRYLVSVGDDNRMVMQPRSTTTNAAPRSLPLFDDQGKATWTGFQCPRSEQTDPPAVGCTQTITGMTAVPDAERDEQGRRRVTGQPCGHEFWMPDPIPVTTS